MYPPCQGLDGQILVVCEKPSSARKIAKALDESGKLRIQREGGVQYYLAFRNNEELRIVYALGHLFSIKQDIEGWSYPVLEMKWVPSYLTDNSKRHTRKLMNL